MSRKSGFTLIELMVVVAILAILGAIALPSYKAYVMRGRIPDATTNLASKRVKMEQFFQDNRTYVGAPAGDSDTGTSAYFNFSAGATRSVTGYTLTAQGKGPMAGFTYTVDQANAKTSQVAGVTGWSGSTTCWVTKPGGVC